MSPDRNNEDYLIEAAISGDKDAFGKLYDRYFTPIYKYLLLRSATAQDAEDLAETVFLKSWEHLPGFGSKNKERFFRAWLFKIAHNTLVDHYRSLKKEQVDEEVFEQQQGGPDPETILALSEKAVRIKESIRHLDEREQDVIVCRFFSGLSGKETALSLGISAGNVRVVQYRALKKLKGILEDNNG